MKKLVLVLLAVLCAGVAARSLYRFLADEEAWRTDKAVQLTVLRQAELHRKTAETFRNYPTEPSAEWVTSRMVNDLNRSAETEVIDAKGALLRLYRDRGRALSAEEASQADQWRRDVAAWETVNIRR